MICPQRTPATGQEKEIVGLISKTLLTKVATDDLGEKHPPLVLCRATGKKGPDVTYTKTEVLTPERVRSHLPN